MSESKSPNILILGGAGFIGRNLAKYLVDGKRAAHIRVVDKSMKATAWLNTAHKAALDSKIVEYVQADVLQARFKDKIWGGMHFDYVVNLCGETRFGLSEEDYKSKTLRTAVESFANFKEHKHGKFIEVSTAQVYTPKRGKAPNTEEAKIDPWTLQAQYRLKAEEELKKVDGIDWVILRPAIVYGDGDQTGLTPRMMCAATYKTTGEKMKFLWNESLRINTVHVQDLCAAIWISGLSAKPGSVYNVADKSDLSQGSLNKMLGEIFEIKTGFVGSVVSAAAAKLSMNVVAEKSNAMHVPVWVKLTNEHKIPNTPLSPYIDKEMLYNYNNYTDGSKIEKELKDFSYEKTVTVAELKSILQNFTTQGFFPPILDFTK